MHLPAKREVVELRRAVNPLTQALQADEHRPQRPDLDRGPAIHARRAGPHHPGPPTAITSYDELLGSLVEAALGKVAMQQNVDMRKISAWVGMAAVPTAIAGIYGDELRKHARIAPGVGVIRLAALGVMAISCLLLYRTFRRNHWL